MMFKYRFIYKYKMSINFPLYTSLSKDLPDKDLTNTQKNDLVKKISNMDSNGYELVYALIKIYYINSDKNSLFNIPYEGKYVKDEICFDVDKLPCKLKQLVYKFAKLNTKRMKEDLKT
jgi:hypothetical protein